jgi:hypothetical protein
MIRSLLSGLLLAFIAACTVAPQNPSTPSAETPLIARAKIFGNPTKTGGRISPDGQWLSWIAPRDGVLNVWVAPVSDPSLARPLTAEKVRPIRTTFWSPDSKTVLFINDKGGDENFLLYGVDVASGAQRSFTPFEKTRVEVIHISRKIKDRILVGVNNRDPRWHDVYSLELATAKLTLVRKNDGYAGFLSDDDLTLRVAEKSRDDGGSDYYRISGGQVEPKPMAEVALEDSQTTSPVGFTADGKTLYWIESRGRDTAALVAQDVASGQARVVARHPYRAGPGLSAVVPEERVRAAGPGDESRPRLPESQGGARPVFHHLAHRCRRQVARGHRPRDRTGVHLVVPATGPTPDAALRQPARARRRAAGADVPARDQVA